MREGLRCDQVDSLLDREKVVRTSVGQVAVLLTA